MATALRVGKLAPAVRLRSRLLLEMRCPHRSAGLAYAQRPCISASVIVASISTMEAFR